MRGLDIHGFDNLNTKNEKNPKDSAKVVPYFSTKCEFGFSRILIF
jgi:hypothetical protein